MAGGRRGTGNVNPDPAAKLAVVDCPVSGGEDGAIAGTLSIMLGGAPDDAAVAAEVLAPCGTPVLLGPLGAGEVAKACNQLVVSATIMALGEATVLADRSGLDLDALWSLLSGGYAGSRLLDSRREKLITGDDSPIGIARYMVKDLGFAADIADATGTSPVLLPALRAAFDELVAAGLGDRDIAVSRRFIASRDTVATDLPYSDTLKPHLLHHRGAFCARSISEHRSRRTRRHGIEPRPQPRQP